MIFGSFVPSEKDTDCNPVKIRLTRIRASNVPEAQLDERRFSTSEGVSSTLTGNAKVVVAT